MRNENFIKYVLDSGYAIFDLAVFVSPFILVLIFMYIANLSGLLILAGSILAMIAPTLYLYFLACEYEERQVGRYERRMFSERKKI